MNPPYIPATALGGDLHTPFMPCCWPNSSAPDGIQVGVLMPGGVVAWLMSDGITVDSSRNMDGVRLDPRRPEVAHRIADVLRARRFEVGHLLPVALGGRVGDVEAVVQCSRCLGVVGRHGNDCPDCAGTGTIRRTVPAADVAAVLLAASVAGVEAGAGVVRGVLGEWAQEFVGAITRRCLRVLVTVGQLGWYVQSSVDGTLASGPETGPDGRTCADAALLRLGFAYLSTSAPFGVAVPFLDMEPR